MNPTHPRDRRPQRIAVLAGDGIGKDVTVEAVKVLDAATARWDLPLELVHLDWDADRYLETGETLPEGALDDLRDNFAAIFIGAYGDPRVPDMKHAADILLGIRFGLVAAVPRRFAAATRNPSGRYATAGRRLRRHRLRGSAMQSTGR